MKKITIAILLVSVFCIGCFPEHQPVIYKAEVLAINEKITEGKLIGNFLSSASGSFSNDVIKVSVRFHIEKKLMLRDLKLNHAELIHYRNQNFLMLEVIALNTTIEIKLNNRLLYYGRY